MRNITLLLMVFVLFCAGIERIAAEETIWKPKAEPSLFSPDWSKADETDARATDFFLKNVWPKIKIASKTFDSKLKNYKPGSVYSGKMSDSEKNSGVVCFPVKIEQILPWYAVPKEEDVALRTFTAFAAQGQSEAVCVGVHAFKDVKKVNVTCSSLKGPGNIDASSITSRLSLSYNVNHRNRNKNIHARQVLLLKVDSWDMSKGFTYEWVVDVHVPQDAKPGVYQGAIQVEVDGRKASEFTIKFEVLPFVLTDNGVRTGAFMTPNPAQATEAWCDLNARYGFNTLAWWHLDHPKLTWTWEGIKKEELILSKLHALDGSFLNGKALSAARRAMPDWIKKRLDGPFIVFKFDEVIGIPKDHSKRGPFYKKPLNLKPELGELSEEQKKMICYDRPGWSANFDDKAIETVTFEKNDAFQEFDTGMKRLKKYGFVGPITWFGSGQTISPWEVRVISQRFGQKYSRSNWKWSPEVTPENSNHTWFLANAAAAKTFDRARKKFGWPEVVWCPNDESLQHRGITGRSATCMIGEMMPYIRKYAPGMRIYMVVWHTKEHNWKGIWQCNTLQKAAKTAKGTPSTMYGPYHVICTNCPNPLDRKMTIEAGGEYWNYLGFTPSGPGFSAVRYNMGLNGTRHCTAMTLTYADSYAVQNLIDGQDAAQSAWISGQERANYYLAKDPSKGKQIDHAIASHAMLACRQGIVDRRYVETLRTWAHKKNSAEDIAFVRNLPERIGKIGKDSKGGLDDFFAEVKDESGPQKLRREIAYRIKKLVQQ